MTADAVVLTLDGALPAYDILPGARVITRNSGVARVRHIRSFTAQVPMLVIKAGTLGHTRPEADTRLPADQQILVRDWRAQALFGAKQALVPAHRLIDGEFIREDGVSDQPMIQLIFDSPQILYMDGLEVASSEPELVAI
ncbi:MAG: Hint domain-containing protein [Pelagimonas sp.]|jgi:hypothetical protein|nr:Hint domain-containing protein [Pelagimonas sp.]